ncbi:MAG TPA: PadR family transcriptional regulator [Polyangiaceae bacterium]|nr:PadR family transcriptional regulator [Polyangiaceae bacterium]
MYELIVLSLLMRQPTTGYLIAQIINDIIGPFARASNGRIYPLLAALVKQKFIAPQRAVAAERGGRHTQAYAITERGRARFRELMLDTRSNAREYRELFSFKVTAFDLLGPEEREALIDHYAEFCRAHIAHIRHEADDLARNAERLGQSAEQRALFASTFAHLASLRENELAWCDELRALAAKHAKRRARK